MIYPESMERVAIVAPSKRTAQLIELLYKHGVLHIIDHTKDALDIGSPLPGSATLAELLVKVRSLMHSLGIKPELTTKTSVLGDLESQINTINDEVTANIAAIKQHADELVRLRSELKAYSELAWLHIDPLKLHDSKHLAYLFGTIKDSKGLQESLQKLTQNFYLEHQKNGTGMLLLIENEYAHAARQLLSEKGFVAADHNRLIALDTTLDKKTKDIESSIAHERKTISHLEAKQAHLAREHASFLASADSLLSVEAKKAQTPLRFGVTKNAIFVNGWVPQATRELLERDLDTQLGQEIAFHKVHTGHHEEAPIKLNNSFAVSPYEALLRLYTLPKYHEIDPSTLLFLSFPIFYGFMLGDIGYGLLLLALFMIIRAVFRESREMAALANIFIMSAVSTIVFGIIFGEFFGYEHIGHLELHPLLHRAHDMITLLIVSIVIGVIHITIAYLVGFVNELRHHGLWKAFAAKISWLLLMAAFAFLGLGFTIKPAFMMPGIILAIVSIILIYLGEGIRGLVELPGLLSNIMSYARLMALGVASAALAIVINDMAGQLFHTGGIVGIIGGVLILIIGHAINFVLGIIGPFLHSLRLHYVEFFSKFYEGGGKPYKPFGVDES